MKPDDQEELTNYLYRTGIDHFIDVKDFKAAGKSLLDFYWLLNLFNLGKTPSDINSYWSQLPISKQQIDACYLFSLMGKDHVGYSDGDFGLGKDWVGFMENEIYDVKSKNSIENIDDYWAFDIQKNKQSEIEEEKLINNLLTSEEMDIEANLESEKDMRDLLTSESDQESLDSIFDPGPIRVFKNYKEWYECVKEDYDYFEPMEKTEIRLSFYNKLSDFFLLSRICHSGVELSARICRLNIFKNGGTDTSTILALNRLSSFYSLWDGQGTDCQYNEQHLPTSCGQLIHSNIFMSAPSIFHYCLKFIIDEYGLTSQLLPILLQNPCAMFPDVINLNIKSKNKTLIKISDLLYEVSNFYIKSKGEKHPSSLDIKMRLANRLYFDMKLREAISIIKNVYKDLFAIYGLEDERTLKALEIKGNIEFELEISKKQN